MKELTKAENEIMQILWRKGQAFVQEIIEEMLDPKPAYNTVSTVIRILTQKGVVGFEAFGRSHRYFPLVKKEVYTKSFMQNVMRNFFSDSPAQLVSFFTRQENLSLKEMEELKNQLDVELRKKRKIEQSKK
jgi:predicted transcriptional regulator